jgi:uncharacterized protein
MNSEETNNVRIVQKAYADFSRGDIPAVLSALADEVEWISPGDLIPLSGMYKGRSGVTQFFEAVAASWDFHSFTPREFIASGDRVVVRGDYQVTSRDTGRSGGCEWVMLWRLADGRVTHFQEFTDTHHLAGLLGAAAGEAARAGG